jgi:uncharacterized membrane-anchored protein YhcB (DUF1043 family)
MLIKLKLWAAAAGAFVLAIAAAFLMGRFKQAAVHKVQTLKNYKTTREAIDDADDFNDVGGATKFLCKRKSKRDL